MYSLRDHFADGQVAELGGELIDTGHVHLQRLAGELGLALDDFRGDDPKLSQDVWFFGGERRTDEALVEAFLPVAERIQASLATLADPEGDIGYRTPNGAEALDQMPLAEWLERSVPEGWLRTLLDVGYTAEYGLEVGEQSALNLLMMLSVEAPPFRIYGESDERFHVRGGNDSIPRALARRLEDALTLETRLEAVRVRADGRYECTLRRGSTSFTDAAREVVLALPFTLLREVRLDVPLPAVKRQAIERLRYGTNAKLMVGFSERVWRTRHGSNGSTLTDLPYQVTWETSRMQPGRSGVLVNFTGGRRGARRRHAPGPGGASHRGAGARLPRSDSRPTRHEGGALPLAELPLHPGLLRLSRAGGLDVHRRRGGRAGGRAALRGRAHLARGAGLHGGRLRVGRARGPGPPQDARREGPAYCFGRWSRMTPSQYSRP